MLTNSQNLGETLFLDQNMNTFLLRNIEFESKAFLWNCIIVPLHISLFIHILHMMYFIVVFYTRLAIRHYFLIVIFSVIMYSM